MIATTKTNSTSIIIMALLYCTMVPLARGENVHGSYLRGLSDDVPYHPKDKTVYVIRHGNKKSENGDLCDAGTYRAEQLVYVFNGTQYHQNSHTFATPEALFYYKYLTGESKDHQRCYETLNPIHKVVKDKRGKNLYRHEIGSGDDANSYAASQIRTNSDYGLKNNQVVLVAWEHTNIKGLALTLGYNESEHLNCKWPKDEEFDFVYTFRYANGPENPPSHVSCSKEGITQSIPNGKYGNWLKYP